MPQRQVSADPGAGLNRINQQGVFKTESGAPPTYLPTKAPRQPAKVNVVNVVDVVFVVVEVRRRESKVVVHRHTKYTNRNPKVTADNPRSGSSLRSSMLTFVEVRRLTSKRVVTRSRYLGVEYVRQLIVKVNWYNGCLQLIYFTLCRRDCTSYVVVDVYVTVSRT